MKAHEVPLKVPLNAQSPPQDQSDMAKGHAVMVRKKRINLQGVPPKKDPCLIGHKGHQKKTEDTSRVNFAKLLFTL